MASGVAVSLSLLGSVLGTNIQSGFYGLNQYYVRNACQARIEQNRIIQVDVDDNLPYYISNPNATFNKEGEQWVLIKENAPIPAWKVSLRDWYATRGNPPKGIAEMERIGKAIPVAGSTNFFNPDIGQEVWIGSGWCDPQTGKVVDRGGDLPDTTKQGVCLDPLVQDVLYVVNRRCNIPGNCATLEEYNDPANYDPVACDCVPGYPNVCLNGNNWLICRAWGEQRMNEPPHTFDNVNWYWWSFNVYYRASKLPAHPTYDDLPCWIRLLSNQCPGGGDVMGETRLAALYQQQCETPVLAATSQETTRPGLIFKRDDIALAVPMPSEMLNDTVFISHGQLDFPVDQYPIIGTAFNGHFYVRLYRNPIVDSAASYALILDPAITVQKGLSWLFIPISGVYRPEARTLQLGTFIPGFPTFSYEWWTPSCKPAIYLYPEEETELTVKVEPEGYITESIPEYGKEGWSVTAYPEGRIRLMVNGDAARYGDVKRQTKDVTSIDTDNHRTYPYLYYEASLANITVPKDRGWIKSAHELPVFFADILPRLGLNKQETKDFTDYWIPKLTGEGEQWYITLIDREELDRVEKISFSKEPDTFIRVRFYFEKLDYSKEQKSPLRRPAGEAGNKGSKDQIANSEQRTANFLHPYQEYLLQSPKLPKPIQRSGFSAVDWGGIIGNGSCGVNEYVQ